MPEVKATMVASASLDPKRKSLAARIEQAMSKAVLECSEKGITDPVEIKAAMMAAREAVLNEGSNAN